MADGQGEVDFSNSIVVNRKYINTVFKGCNFNGATFDRCIFSGATFMGCQLTGIKLLNCVVTNSTLFLQKMRFSVVYRCKIVGSEFARSVLEDPSNQFTENEIERLSVKESQNTADDQ